MNLGTAYVALEAEVKGLRKDLGEARKEVTKATTAMQANANKTAMIFKKMWIAVAAGAAAMAGMAIFYKRAIDAANKQELAEKKLEAVIKATGQTAGFTAQQMAEMARGLQAVTTYGDELIIEAQAILATFKQVRGEAFQRTTEAALDMATVMGTDLRSSMIQLGKALNDPIANLGALGRAGVQFTKDQKEQIKTLWESGQIMKAQNIILKELETQFGGTARSAAQTFGGAMLQLKNVMSDTMEAIGFGTTKNQELITSIHMITDSIIRLTEEGSLTAWAETFGKGMAYVVGLLSDAIGFWADFFKLTKQAKLEAINQQLEYQQSLLRHAGAETISTGEVSINIGSKEIEIQNEINRLLKERTQLMAEINEKTQAHMSALSSAMPSKGGIGGGAGLGSITPGLLEEGGEMFYLPEEMQNEAMEQALEYYKMQEEAWAEHWRRRAEIADEALKAEQELNYSHWEAINAAEIESIKIRATAQQQYAGFFLNLLGYIKTKSLAAQLAILAIQTGVQYWMAVASAQAAAALALATLPPPVGEAVAAARLTYGMTLAHGILIAGAGKAIGLGISAATAGGTSASGYPSYATPTSRGPAIETISQEKPTTTIIIEGDVLADEYYIEQLAEKISGAVEDREVRLVASTVREY